MAAYLVLDFGGSSVKGAVMDEAGCVVERFGASAPVESLGVFESFVEDSVKDHGRELAGVAISMPGVIDHERGYVYTGGAYGALRDIELGGALERLCGLPVTVANDARCAAAAEVAQGALSDVRDGAVVLLGTGVGGCLVIDRKVRCGPHCSSGEFSYLKLDRSDPFSWAGTWDVRSGSNGLLERVREEDPDVCNLTGHQIFARVHAGDEAVLRAVENYAADVALGIFDLHVVFDCERVAIGGGISAQSLLVDAIRRAFDEIYEHLAYPFPKPEIVACRFGNDANLIGALQIHRMLKG